MKEPADLQQPGALRRAAVSSARWTTIESVFQQLVTVVSTAALARLLVPEDFGAIAGATVLVGLIEMVCMVGLSPALIQRTHLDHRVVSTYWWTSVAIGAGASLTAVAFSPLLAASFGRPELEGMVAVLACSMLPGIPSGIARGLLLRRLQFGRAALVTVIKAGVYALVAVGLAWVTALGAWSVILGKLVATVVRAVGVHLAAGLRPRLHYRWSDIQPDLSFSVAHLGSSVTSYFSKNLDYWVVARAMGDSMLGFYYIAYVFPNLIRQRFTQVARTTLFPVLARIREDRTRIARAYLNAVRFVAFVVVPVFFGLATVADLAMVVVWGQQWLAAARTTSVLAISAGLEAVSPVSGSMLAADGVPRKNFFLEVIRIVVLVPGLLVAARLQTLEAFAWAVLLATGVTFATLQLMAIRRLQISGTRYLRVMVPVAVPTMVMVGTVLVSRRLVAGLTLPPIVELGVAVSVGACTYAAVGLIFFRRVFRNSLADALSLVLPARKPRPPTPGGLDEPIAPTP